MPDPTCLRCHGAMELGFVPEATLGGFFVSVWHPGDATRDGKSWSERLASPGGIRYARDTVLAIDAWRCGTCGHVELFANRPPEHGEAL